MFLHFRALQEEVENTDLSQPKREAGRTTFATMVVVSSLLPQVSCASISNHNPFIRFFLWSLFDKDINITLKINNAVKSIIRDMYVRPLKLKLNISTK